MVPGQAEVTQIIIMLNLFDGVKKPADIGRNIGITVQGVQYHMKTLKQKGLVTADNTISQKGFEFLYSGLNNMRGFVAENIFKLDKVIVWEAISEDEFEKGQEVFLAMKEGYLSAYGNQVSQSRGVTVTKGRKGGIVGVTRVEGIIDVAVKNLTIVILPDVEDVAENDEILKKIGNRLGEINADMTAVIGEEAAYVARVLKISKLIEYSPLEASFEAASRGLSSVILVSNRRFRFLLESLRILENKNEGVNVRLMNI